MKNLEEKKIEELEKSDIRKTSKLSPLFRPDKTTSIEKKVNGDEVEQSWRGKQIMKEFQGDIGERSCIQLATKGMGWKPELEFEQTKKGFDGIFRDNENKIVIVESKVTDKNGIKSLGKDQMTMSGIENIAQKMQDPFAKDYYSIGNAKIGKEILEEGQEKTRRVLFWLEPSTLRWTCYECKIDNNWETLKTFDATDPTFDGPYLE